MQNDTSLNTPAVAQELAELEALKKEVKDKDENFEKIAPLINNYSIIFTECLKGKGRLKPIVQKCYLLINISAFKEFTQYIDKRDVQIKRMWSSNNLNGFIALVEGVLLYEEENNKK